jgi:molecular chaperone GrpE (heat shock protein)
VANETVLDEIKAELAGLHAQSRFLNEVIDRMHAENERLRQAESRASLAPALRELIRLADNWRRRAADLGEGSELAKLCGEMVDDVTMILDRQGVEEFHAEPGEEFDRHRHRAVGTRPTAESAQEGVVVEMRTPGYRGDGRVVRFAEVVVFKFVTSAG